MTMSDTLLRQVALVNESSRISAGDLARVSAALQKQATRDLIQFWGVKATVDAFPTLEDVPIGYWPIIIKDDIETSGAAGVHLDDQGQPFALVTAASRLEEWSLTASHELVEMLVDPFGNRLIAADSPKRDQGRVQVLVEACDPSEAAQFAYTINGILVSDFYSVRYFDPVAARGVRYSFTGAIRKPRQVLPGGYLSWLDPASGNWWQAVWFDGGPAPQFRSLGRLDAARGSFRSQIDRRTMQPSQPALAGGLRAARASGLPSALTDKASTARAARLRAQIAELTGDAGDTTAPPSHGMDEPAVPAPLRAAAGGAPRRSGNGRMPDMGALREAPSVWEYPDDPPR
jgi:hypothetical protein